MFATRKTLKLTDVYLARIGRRNNQHVWIVDGNLIARDIYPEWIFGGNDMRYRFNPANEVWIDSRIGVEELETTIRHEVLERRLMKFSGLTYNKAHDRALAIEPVLRPRWERQCRTAGARLIAHAHMNRVSKLLAVPTEKLLRLYRQPVGAFMGCRIWIVDGTIVRQEIAPNYGSADSLGMRGIVPTGEFWLDSSMSALEAYFALYRRKALHRLSLVVSEGTVNAPTLEGCYDQALAMEVAERKRQFQISRRHEERLKPVQYGARNRAS